MILVCVTIHRGVRAKIERGNKLAKGLLLQVGEYSKCAGPRRWVLGFEIIRHLDSGWYEDHETPVAQGVL